MIPLTCRELTIEVNGRTLVRALDLELAAGEFMCVLGPNGVGKTLTLHTLAGLREPAAGEILLDGVALSSLNRSHIARRLGLLLQNQDDAFPATVLETALMGRHAQMGFWQWENPGDIQIARNALEAMDLSALTGRISATLSGGERRRLALATLLVQDPDVMLLDEPMNHLDPLHRLTVLGHLARLTRGGKSVIASLHDPALASHFAGSVLLLFGDGEWECGEASAMLSADNMERLYGTPFAPFDGDGRSVLLPVA